MKLRDFEAAEVEARRRAEREELTHLLRQRNFEIQPTKGVILDCSFET